MPRCGIAVDICSIPQTFTGVMSGSAAVLGAGVGGGCGRHMELPV